MKDLGKDTAGDATALNARRKPASAAEEEVREGLPQASGGRKEYTDDVHELLSGEGIKPVIQNRKLWKEEPLRMLPGHDGNSNIVYDEAGTLGRDPGEGPAAAGAAGHGPGRAGELELSAGDDVPSTVESWDGGSVWVRSS